MLHPSLQYVSTTQCYFLQFVPNQNSRCYLATGTSTCCFTRVQIRIAQLQVGNPVDNHPHHYPPTNVVNTRNEADLTSLVDLENVHLGKNIDLNVKRKPFPQKYGEFVDRDIKNRTTSNEAIKEDVSNVEQYFSPKTSDVKPENPQFDEDKSVKTPLLVNYTEPLVQPTDLSLNMTLTVSPS